MKLGPYVLGPTEDGRQGIYTGDARELVEAIPDESVDLILTDPVYDQIDDYRWLAEMGARVLKSDSACLVYTAIGSIPQVHRALEQGGLSYRWRLVTRNVNSKQFCGRLLICSKECLWYEKGRSRLYGAIFDVDLSTQKGQYYNVGGANWGKGTSVPLRYVSVFCPPGGVVLDPFSGLGTFPALAKLLGRRWLGFEIDPVIAETARERIYNTKIPLFTPEPEQLPLEALS